LPTKPVSPCRYPGCPEFATNDGYCRIHRIKIDRLYNQQRGTPSERGYDTTWNKVRKAYLSKHPLCESCNKEHRITPAAHVHHVQDISKRPDLRLDYDNLMSLCKPCHTKITFKEQQA